MCTLDDFWVRPLSVIASFAMVVDDWRCGRADVVVLAVGACLRCVVIECFVPCIFPLDYCI